MPYLGFLLDSELPHVRTRHNQPFLLSKSFFRGLKAVTERGLVSGGVGAASGYKANG